MSDHARTDRNLLFGILALQMDFISRDALIAAMNSWVLDKTTTLGRILLDQQTLAQEEHDLLEALVGKHLQKHGGDPRRSLAAVRPLGSTCQELQQTTDAELHASLACIGATSAGEDGARADRACTTGSSTSAGLRFRILRPHARGGLGEVFVARDTELHRDVALKEIQDRHADNPHSRARFVLEAEITGGLEHPGIVPVYGLGQHADGRPYYAMRFIKGDSLEDAIERFHQADVPDREAGERALALRQLLGRFVAVCNAIAYAHSRGVLHRDLKPGNIMLGPYGETMVVDWGLAKPLGQWTAPEEGLEAALQPVAIDQALRTQMGSVVGTPAFMPPEQARGQVDQMRPASDVYSLGATLYCLLTGKAPFVDQDLRKVLEKVQRGDFLPPRAVKPDVPPALEAVCLKAMALRPADRYADPRQLAADIERWLADEPVRAWREPWRLRAGRWARRHQKSVAALAAALLVTLLATGSGLWWLDRQRTEQRRDVEAALAEVWQLQAEARWDEARAVLGRAEGRLGEGGPRDLRERLEQARNNIDLVAQLDAIRLRETTLVKGGLFDRRGADQAYEQTLRQAGLGEVGSDPTTAAAWVAGSAMRAGLVAALDDWAGCTDNRERRAWLLEVSRRADPDPWRDAARDPAVWEDAAALARLAGSERLLDQSPQLLTALGKQLRFRGGDSELVLRPAQQRYPNDFWVNFDLGNALAEEKPEEALGYYRAALALRPGTAAVYYNLGNTLYDEEQLDEAIAAYRRAIDLDPREADAHTNLGIALRDKGQLDRAIAALRKAIELKPSDALAHNALGNALRDKGLLDDALAAHRKAIDLKPRYANAYNSLGTALHDKGRFDDAIAAYRKAIDLDPKFTKAHTNLGNTLRARGRLDDAIAAYRKAIELSPRNAPAHNSLANALRDRDQLDDAIATYRKAIDLDPRYANAYNGLGNALSSRGRLDDAIAAHRKAIELNPKDVLAHFNLGLDLVDKRHLDQAIAAFRKAIEIDPRHALSHNSLGNALRARGQLDDAIAAYRKAIELNPSYAYACNNLGVALHDKGQLDEAIAAYRKAIEIDSRDVLAHSNLGNALRENGRLQDAIAAYRKALQIDPRHSLARPNLAETERMLAVEKKLAAVLEGQAQPADVAERLTMARLCLLKKLPVAAGRFYADAFAAEPKLTADPTPGHRYYAACAAALASAGQGQDAATLTDKERARLRRQALDWLRADLEFWKKHLEKCTPQERAPVRSKLQYWQRHTDLASLRDPMMLAKLPEAERADYRKLWEDVAALLEK